MSRALTRRRHCKHRTFPRLRHSVSGRGSDSLDFLTDQANRIRAAEAGEGVHDSLCAEGDSAQTPGARSNQFTFEDVQAADDPFDIGLTFAQTKSLDFDGANEAMTNMAGISFGVGDDFTYATWVKRVDLANEFEFVYFDSAGGDNNRIQFSTGLAGRPDGSPRFVVFDGVGDRIKDFYWANSDWPINTWTFWVFTWSGTPGSALLGYVNGVLTAEDFKNRDFTGNRSDAPMRYLHANDPGLACRRLYSAWWNTVLTGPEILELYNSGTGGAVDLRTDGTNYVSSASNKHWWRYGHKVSPNLGEDFGGGSPLIDLGVDAIGMTDDDIVIDAPP